MTKNYSEAANYRAKSPTTATSPARSQTAKQNPRRGPTRQHHCEGQFDASSASTRGARRNRAVERELGPLVRLAQRTYQRPDDAHAQRAVPDILAPRVAVAVVS